MAIRTSNITTIVRTLNGKRLDIGLVSLALIIYAITTLPLSDWLIDDAGITFAYARNLAEGHGLVAQPGIPPVEGYSNFLWLLILTPFFWFGLFDPYVTSKLLSLLFVGTTFALLYNLVVKITEGNRLAASGTIFLLATNTSYIAWSCSGLESSLFIFLIVWLLHHLRVGLVRDQLTNSWAISCGLIALLISLTRPDGVVYSLLFYPIVLLKPGPIRQILKNGFGRLATWYSLTFGAGYGFFLLFRYLYFGYLQPNTYYAKGGPSAKQLIPAFTLQNEYLSKFVQLSESLFGDILLIALPLIILILFTLNLSWNNRWRDLVLLAIFSFTAYFTYLLMPHDWMGEFRFALPLMPLVYTLSLVLISITVSRINVWPKSQKIILIPLLGLLLVGHISLHYQRHKDFVSRKVVAMERIASTFARPYNHRAELIGTSNPSILLPDIGAMLYYSDLRVYDLVGLVDPVITRTLKADKQAFHNYVFDIVKPTFIHIHGNWTYAARLDDDSRFRRDYTPLQEYEDKFIKNNLGLTMMSGDYVRKDAVADDEELLQALRQIK